MTTPLATALADLDTFSIEVPSWAYGNSGTRFKVFTTPGTPRDPFEKTANAAHVNAVTGSAPRVSIHIPWDKIEDYAVLSTHAKELGVPIGSVNSNLFQDDDYRLGSLTNKDKEVCPSTSATPSTPSPRATSPRPPVCTSPSNSASPARFLR